MDHREYSIAARDHLRLYAQRWSPNADPRGVICLVHGLGEHSGRYAYVAGCLASAGYAVVAIDLRGHGRSDGPRGHSPSNDQLMDDISRLVESGRSLYPAHPLFLYGHSLGGSLVLNFALRSKPLAAGLVVTSPGLVVGGKVPAWKTALGQFLYDRLPGLRMPNGLDRSALSRDPAVISAYAADPLVHDRISVRWGIDLLRTGQWAIEHAGELTIPLLLMQGGADRIVSVEAVRQFAEKAGGEITFKLWEGGYHELHNEPIRDEVLQTMLAWLEVHSCA